MEDGAVDVLGLLGMLKRETDGGTKYIESVQWTGWDEICKKPPHEIDRADVLAYASMTIYHFVPDCHHDPEAWRVLYEGLYWFYKPGPPSNIRRALRLFKKVVDEAEYD